MPVTDVAEPDSPSPHFDATDPDGHVVRVNQLSRGKPRKFSVAKVETPDDFHALLRRELGLGDAYDGSWPTLSRLLAGGTPRPPRKVVIKDWAGFRSRLPEPADRFVKTVAAHNATNVDWTVRLKLDDVAVL